MQEPSTKDWAEAIALRISDEWDGGSDSPEDKELMREVLSGLLAKSPEACEKLIGTSIIEEDYFDPLD